MIIRFFGARVSQIRKMSFKRPPPEHIYKREIVPSDLDGSKLKNTKDCENDKWTKRHITEPSFKEKGEKHGKDLYFPKYGASIYDDTITTQYKELNSRKY